MSKFPHLSNATNNGPYYTAMVPPSIEITGIELREEFRKMPDTY